MITDTQTVAKFLASILWADNDFSDVERSLVHEFADAFDLPSLVADVDTAASEMKTLDNSAIDKYLTDAANRVAPEEKEGLLALCLQLMGADSYLAKEEISNFFFLANKLNISEEHAKALLSMFSEDDEAPVDKDEL